jgi:hypothetical protein
MLLRYVIHTTREEGLVESFHRIVLSPEESDDDLILCGLVVRKDLLGSRCCGRVQAHDYVRS